MNTISAATGHVLALSMLADLGPATLRKITAVTDFERTTVDQWAGQVPALERALNANKAWSKALEKAQGGGSLHASRAAVLYSRWLAVPYPTDKHRTAAAPKIQANLGLADGRSGEKAELLQCAPTALDHLIILRSRDDYARMTTATTALPSRSLSPSQRALL